MFGARNDAVAIRKKQVATLSQYFPASTVREVRCPRTACEKRRCFFPPPLTPLQLQPDVLYEIPVAAPGRILVRVSIHLPEQFPYQPPVLQCVPSVPTPHMDMNGYVKPTANESLARWSVQNNLGKLVYEVIAGVIAPATPAAPVGGAPPSTGGNSGGGAAPSVYPPLASPPPASGGFGKDSFFASQRLLTLAVSSPASQPHLSNPHHTGAAPTPSSSQPRRIASEPARVDMPPIPATFDELDGKPLEMLRNFATSEDHLMLFLEDVQYYQGLRKLRDAARDATAAQAQKVRSAKLHTCPLWLNVLHAEPGPPRRHGTHAAASGGGRCGARGREAPI